MGQTASVSATTDRPAARLLPLLVTVFLALTVIGLPAAGHAHAAEDIDTAVNLHASFATTTGVFTLGLAEEQPGAPTWTTSAIAQGSDGIKTAPEAPQHDYDHRANIARPSATLDHHTLAPQGASLPLHRPGSLSAADARAFYLEGERGIAALADDLAAAAFQRGRVL